MPARIRRELSRSGRRRAPAAVVAGAGGGAAAIEGSASRSLRAMVSQACVEPRSAGRPAAPIAAAARETSGKERESRVPPGAGAVPREQRPGAPGARTRPHAHVILGVALELRGAEQRDAIELRQPPIDLALILRHEGGFDPPVDQARELVTARQV